MNIQTKAKPNRMVRPSAATRVADRAADAEADGEAHRRHDEHAPGDERRVGAHPPGDDGQQPDGQAAQAVEEAALLVVGDAARGAHALEEHAGHDEARHQEVDVVQVSRVGHGATEDVAEDEQEEHPLRRAGDDQRRRAHELLERPAPPPGPRRRDTTRPGSRRRPYAGRPGAAGRV